MEQTPSRKHFPALDGLRGIAILAVMFFHYDLFTSGTRPVEQALHAVFRYGFLGVDLFFVLSGFLITGILIDTREKTGYFRIFYLRRFFRIFPVYYAYLALAFVGQRITHRIVGTTGWHANYLWYIAYLQNWQPGYGATDFYLLHLWSLAVEEQFYIFWPLLILLVPKRWLPWFCGSIVLVVMAARVVSIGPVGVEGVWRLTPFRMDALCLGALMAVFLRSPGALVRVRYWRVPICAACLACFGVAQFRGAQIRTASWTVIAIVFAFVVLAAAETDLPILSSRFLRTMGKYSYAMYLFHLAPHLFVFRHLAAWLAHRPAWVSLGIRLVYLPVMMFLVFCIARISWTFLERPFLRMKERFSFDPSPRVAVYAP